MPITILYKLQSEWPDERYCEMLIFYFFLWQLFCTFDKYYSGIWQNWMIGLQSVIEKIYFSKAKFLDLQIIDYINDKKWCWIEIL